ncbi:cytochrome P450 [Streptomyces sp. NPDC000594]|uniref:cytochrome P450 n=1 Tax=Streptomyces sp. NPDC000594 TaxID=3154261 RepID=UPI00332E6686
MPTVDHTALDALYRDPYPLFARARRTEGLLPVPECDAWLVARDEDVREVLLRPDDFSSRDVLRPDVLPGPAALAVLAGGFEQRPTVVSSDGAEHRRHRAPLNRALSAGQVSALMPYARRCAESLVAAFTGGGPDAGPGPVPPHGTAELMSAYALPLSGRVVGRLIGFDDEADADTAVRRANRAEALVYRPLAPDEQVGAAEEVVALQHRIDALAHDRRAAPRDDLCSALVTALAPGDAPLTPDQRHEIVAQVQNFLLAGELTTTALVGTALLHLLTARDQWELLCAKPELIPAAVEEAVRYDTAIQAFRRTTTRPVTLAGTRLPAGAVLLVAYGSANRDEARHERPDVFDITRLQGPGHLAFGHGPHRCPGARLAREQLRLTLELLTGRLPALHLDPHRPAPVMRPTLIHRSPESLPVRW